jgi:LacI family transcriptional regulator
MRFSDSEHLYRQVAEAIESDIRARKFTAKIPGERELARRYKVNFKTANKAVGVLVERGLLSRVKGKGTFIASPSQRKATKLNLIGLIVPELDNPYFAKSAQAIERFAARESISVLLHSPESPKGFNAFLKTLLAHGAQGLIHYGDPTPLIERKLVQAIVGLGTGQPRKGDFIHADVVAGGALVGAHLAERFGGSVAYVGIGNNPTSDDRFVGFRGALSEKGCTLRKDWIRSGENNYRGGYRTTKDLLRLKQRPRAIFLFNDYMAIGAERAIAELGLRVPQDIAVAGFDDSADATDLVVPTTSVRFSFEGTARAALRLLKRRLATPGEPYERVTIRPKLIVRASTGR